MESHPNWAGISSIILAKLRPVGGIGASFVEAETLSDAVVRLLSDEAARKSFIRLSVTVSETGTNSNGSAVIVYDQEGTRRRAYFVPDMAVSLLQPGRENDYDPDLLNSPVSREMSFNRDFFRRLAREIEIAKRLPAQPEGDGSEYDAEEAEQERYRKLGVRQGSRFLNIGVDTQVTWPQPCSPRRKAA